jgi:hypothetical protein
LFYYYIFFLKPCQEIFLKNIEISYTPPRTVAYKFFETFRVLWRITGLFTLFCSIGQTGPVGGSGYGFVGPIASLIPTKNFRRIFPALVLPRKRLRYSRSVRRHWAKMVIGYGHNKKQVG